MSKSPPLALITISVLSERLAAAKDLASDRQQLNATANISPEAVRTFWKKLLRYTR